MIWVFTSSILVSRLPPVQFLGRISLQIYLLHDPVLKIALFRLHLYQVNTLYWQMNYKIYFMGLHITDNPHPPPPSPHTYTHHYPSLLSIKAFISRMIFRLLLAVDWWRYCSLICFPTYFQSSEYASKKCFGPYSPNAFSQCLGGCQVAQLTRGPGNLTSGWRFKMAIKLFMATRPNWAKRVWETWEFGLVW